MPKQKKPVWVVSAQSPSGDDLYDLYDTMNEAKKELNFLKQRGWEGEVYQK